MMMDSGARITLVNEARELLTDMEAALLEMEAHGSNPERINAAFRAAHTIKGSAGLFGLTLIVSFTQVLESVLDQVRDGVLPTDPELISLLLGCGDYLGKLVDAIASEQEDHDPDAAARGALLSRLHALLGGNSNSALSRDRKPSAPLAERHYHLSLRFSREVLQNGMDPLSFLIYLRSLGRVAYLHTVADDLPDAENMEPELCYLGFEVGLCTTVEQRTIEQAFELLGEHGKLRILPPESNVSDYIQIIRSLPQARRKLGELLIASGALRQRDLDTVLSLQAGAMDGVTRPKLGEVLVQEHLVEAPVVAAALNKQRQAEERRASEQKVVKVDAAKLDQLINLIGELVIASEGARIIAARAQRPELVEAMSKVGQIVEHVRDRALDMRMVPIGDVFQRFPRVVRDVSRELGKDIALVITGAESELDKSMVDKLADPLLHIVRNAIDHGIEAVEERVARGKSPQGRLRLNAYHESGYIVIEIQDDGRGLQRDRIFAKAVERGLIDAHAVLTDSEIHQLLFLPGFSTASEVTNLSGRGVGMDVVKRGVELLRGEIEIHSEEGQGTRFRIRLPLTLAIIDGFQVALGETVFVLPLETVVECVDMKSSRGPQNLLSLRGEPLPYLRLREFFQLEPHKGGRESLVVVSHGQQRVGLVVDRLLGDIQAVIKPLGTLFRGLKAVSSSTILGDGTVALILDVPTLITRAHEAVQPAALARASVN